MLSVRAIYETPNPVAIRSVRVHGLLLGTGFDRQFIADSIDAYDQGIALPLVDESLFEQLFENGVSPIGGGRFSFWYNAEVEGQVTLLVSKKFKYGLTNITSFVVRLPGKEITVVPSKNTTLTVSVNGHLKGAVELLTARSPNNERDAG